LPEPILINPDESPREFFLSIPQEEQQCLSQSLSQARLDKILDGAETTEGDERVMKQCVSQETLARTMMGFLVNQVSGLSDGTLRCAWGILAEVDLKGLLASDGDEAGQLIAFRAFLNASLCLTDEEAARAETGVGMDEFPLAGMRCLAGRVGAESLEAMFMISAEQGSPSVEIIAAMLECGIEMGGPEGYGPQFTPEQFACLRGALGDETLAQFFAHAGAPPVEAIAAMLECGMAMLGQEGYGPQLTPEQLACLKGVLGEEGLVQLFAHAGAPPLEIIAAMLKCGIETGGPVGDGPQLTPEQLACVQGVFGDQALAELMAGQRLPTLAEISALGRCDLDLGKLLSGS
jgi:hypothetical protein